MTETSSRQYLDNEQTEREKVLGTDSLSSSTTGARARARARDDAAAVRAQLLRQWHEDACMYYQRCFDRKITPGVARDLAEALAGGLTGEVLRAAMDATQDAPRPSWAYCRAILTRCKRDGIRTAADWAADHERWESRRQANPALQYHQRDYEQEYDEAYWERVTRETLGL